MPQEEQEAPQLTREQVDAVVAEAISRYPECGIDEEAVADTETATAVLNEGQVLTEKLVALSSVIAEEVAKPQGTWRLTLLEGGIAHIVPVIYKYIIPKDHLLAMHTGVLVAGAMAGLCKEMSDDGMIDSDEFVAIATDERQVMLAAKASSMMPKLEQIRLATKLVDRIARGRAQMLAGEDGGKQEVA